MTNRTGGLLLLAIISGFAFTACNKQPIDNLSNEESRIYITDYDSTVSFVSYKTYSISDSVAVVDGNQSVKQLTASDQTYIDAIKKYMSQNGFALVNKNSNPDLGIDVSRVINTSTGIISYPDYYGYYNNYWDSDYWGYGGYDYYTPYSYGVYSIQEGAISIDMLDLKNAAVKNKIELIWTGLIRGEGLADAASSDGQVKALFDQSPYLKTNN